MRPKTTTKLSRTLVNELLHQAQRSPTQETYGLVGQRDARYQCYPIGSASADSRALFSLQSAEQLAAIKLMQDRGQQLFALYQSLPKLPDLPTVIETNSSDFPDVLHLIISLDTRGVLQMRGFQINNKQLEEVNLII